MHTMRGTFRKRRSPATAHAEEGAVGPWEACTLQGCEVRDWEPSAEMVETGASSIPWFVLRFPPKDEDSMTVRCTQSTALILASTPWQLPIDTSLNENSSGVEVNALSTTAEAAGASSENDPVISPSNSATIPNRNAPE